MFFFTCLSHHFEMFSNSQPYPFAPVFIILPNLDGPFPQISNTGVYYTIPQVGMTLRYP